MDEAWVASERFPKVLAGDHGPATQCDESGRLVCDAIGCVVVCSALGRWEDVGSNRPWRVGLPATDGEQFRMIQWFQSW